MQLRPFGPTNRQVPIIGEGTWNIESADRPAAIAAIRHGLDLGLTHLDTAEIYGAGESEKIVGEAIANRRHEVFLVSKVAPTNASRAGTITACEKSLARLHTDHLDCYLLHWRGSHPLAETLAAFEDLQQRGKILSWGVSNFNVDDLEEALQITGNDRIACNQVLYHLQERAIEHAVIPWCEKHNIAVVAYSPFGQNQFPTPTSPAGRILQEIAAAHAATPRQVALRYLLRHPSVFTIPKASTSEHITENAAANLQLTAADIVRIDHAFPLGPLPRHLPTL